MGILTVERVSVDERHIEALVHVRREFLRTSVRAGIAEQALVVFPGLTRHTCENDSGKRFADEMRDTETAHLLEHLTCEIMSLSGSPRTLHAETAWDFSADGLGVFRLRFEFDDDLVAIGALKVAAEVIEWLFEGGEQPNLEAGLGHLRDLRGESRSKNP